MRGRSRRRCQSPRDRDRKSRHEAATPRSSWFAPSTSSVPSVSSVSSVVELLGTGRGVRIAVIDSGVHGGHPHVGGVSGGVAIDADGREHADYIDRLGHGTAVTAAIRDLAPDTEIFAVKVFDTSLWARLGSLIHGRDWA